MDVAGGIPSNSPIKMHNISAVGRAGERDRSGIGHHSKNVVLRPAAAPMTTKLNLDRSVHRSPRKHWAVGVLPTIVVSIPFRLAQQGLVPRRWSPRRSSQLRLGLSQPS